MHTGPVGNGGNKPLRGGVVLERARPKGKKKIEAEDPPCYDANEILDGVLNEKAL